MAVRFACANCGKHHRISDGHAGKPGRCGRCGHRFIAPGSPVPAPSTVFMPVAVPDPWDDDRSSRSRPSGPSSAIIVGVLLGIIALFVIVDFRDQIIAMIPGAAPALPAKAPVALIAARQPNLLPDPAPAPLLQVDWSRALTVAQVVFLAALIVVGMIVPFAVPPILSRRGYLSVSRWLIMGATVAVLAMGNTLLIVAFSSKIEGIAFHYAMMLSLLVFPFYFSFAGCLLAAAIHPKTTV